MDGDVLVGDLLFQTRCGDVTKPGQQVKGAADGCSPLSGKICHGLMRM